MSHTPGPWFVESDGSYTNGLPTIGITCEQGILAEFYVDDNGENNACLVSYAPDLLERLELIMDLLVMDDMSNYTDEQREALMGSLELTQKARGLI